MMVPRALGAAEQLAERGINAEVIDVRSLVPLDTATILGSLARTGRLFTVEENRGCSAGAPRSARSRSTRLLGAWTARSSGSRRRTSRCRPRTRSKIS